jgi:hypothetical protein
MTMKKHIIKIVISVCTVLLISGFGAVFGTIVNDKVQDSKIDLILKDVSWIKEFLLKKK